MSKINNNRLEKKIKRQIMEGLLFYRRITSQLRLMPDFIIIGGQRCGTSSLYNYLVQHPCVFPAFTKEVHFFDINFEKGIPWYRSYFPSILSKHYYKKTYKQKILTGESTPYYFFHPHVPERIFNIIPNVKLILLLRDPVDRAYSHYQHNLSWGGETLSFEEAINKEYERINKDFKEVLKDDNHYSYNHRHYSYLFRGIYIYQLKRWLKHFSREQFHIIKSEDFFTHPKDVLCDVFKFLNLPIHDIKDYKIYGKGDYDSMNKKFRDDLYEFFKPYNESLFEYLGRNFNWESSKLIAREIKSTGELASEVHG